jgi:hypothetical protein
MHKRSLACTLNIKKRGPVSDAFFRERVRYGWSEMYVVTTVKHIALSHVHYPRHMNCYVGKSELFS